MFVGISTRRKTALRWATPALLTDTGETLSESMAILNHIAARSPQSGIAFAQGTRDFDRLNEMLVREGRMELAQACFDFLPVRSRLDLAGWDEIDIFAHA